MESWRGDLLGRRLDAASGCRTSGRSRSRRSRAMTLSSSPAFQRTTCRIGPNTSRQLARRCRARRYAARRRCRRAPAPRLPRRTRPSLRIASTWPSRRCLRVGVDDRADIGRRSARIAELQLARGAGDHLEHAVGDVLLHDRAGAGRAALAGGAEGGHHDVVGDLLGQRGGVGDHGVDAAGLGDQRHDRAVLGGERAVDRPGDLGRAGEGDAGDVAGGRPAPRRRAPSPGTRCSASAGMPASCSSRTASEGDQRRLLGRLGDDGVAGGERRRDLAEEDGEREIPRADADEAPRPRRTRRFSSPVGPGSGGRRSRNGRGLGGVVAAEIDRLADLRDGVVERLAGLACEQRQQRSRRASIRSAARSQRGGARRRGRARSRRRKPACAASMARSASAGVGLARRVPTTACRRSASATSRAVPPAVLPPMSGPACGERRPRRPAISASKRFEAARLPNSTPAEFFRAAEEIGRQRDAAMARVRRLPMSLGRAARAAARSARRDRWRADEGGIGAVLEQPAHEIGEQLLVAADRRIDAAGEAVALAHRFS